MNEYMHAMPSGWKNRGVKPVAFDLALDALVFLAVYPLLSFILMRSGYGKLCFALPLITLAFMTVSTFIRRKAPGTLVYFPAELAAAALAVFIAPGMYARILTGVVCFIALVYSGTLYVRTLLEHDKNLRDPYAPPVNYYAGGGLLAAGVAVLYFTFLVSIYFKFGTFQLLSAACCCAFLTLYVVYQHMSGSQAIRNDADDVGASSLKKLGRRIALFTAFIVPAAAAAMYFIYIFSGLSGVDRAFVSFITSQHDAVPQTTVQVSSSGRHSDYIEKLQQLTGSGGRTNPAVRYALDFLIALASVAALLLLAYFVFKRLRTFFSLRKNPDEIRRSVFSVRQTSARTGGHVFPRFDELLGRSNSIKIRRLYRRMVVSSQNSAKAGGLIEKSDSPVEILGKIGPDDCAEKATDIYERARYGAGETSADAAGEMKRLTSERSRRARK